MHYKTTISKGQLLKVPTPANIKQLKFFKIKYVFEGFARGQQPQNTGSTPPIWIFMLNSLIRSFFAFLSPVLSISRFPI